MLLEWTDSLCFFDIFKIYKSYYLFLRRTLSFTFNDLLRLRLHSVFDYVLKLKVKVDLIIWKKFLIFQVVCLTAGISHAHFSALYFISCCVCRFILCYRPLKVTCIIQMTLCLITQELIKSIPVLWNGCYRYSSETIRDRSLKLSQNVCFYFTEGLL